MEQTALYIVFILNHKYKDHDGEVFRDYAAAKKYCSESMDEFPDWKLKGIIGMFVLEPRGEMSISHVETFGFPNDKKAVNQLQLFADYECK